MFSVAPSTSALALTFELDGARIRRPGTATARGTRWGTALANSLFLETRGMNLKLLVGIVLFVIGMITAVIGIIAVGDARAAQSAVAAGQQNGPLQQALSNIAVPAVAGLCLAVGGLLIGLSMGRWKNPRTALEPGDAILDPEGYQKMKHV